MRTVHHSTRIQQDRVDEATSRIQDEAFFDAQLLRSITLALSSVGFDSVMPTALEAFRAQVDQYMRRFLSLVHSSMVSNRRMQPIPQDFVTALAKFGLKPKELLPHVQLPLIPSIVQPPVPPGPPEEPPLPSTNDILGPELVGLAIREKYIPAHLPPLPSRHTWKDTEIYTNRETDARKIRELATEEGVLAEKAMRKLMAGAALSKPALGGRNSRKDQIIWEQTMNAILKMDEEQAPPEDGIDWPGGGETAASLNTAIPVNYDRRFWRQSARGT
ncbi:hypothetical protein FKW77_010761 [Venturia effusa]|uniref:Transcription initiation factor TFIID subunit 8 n=1 Tax=Venturia effusa TaxID=50376 RepID=A0A517KYD4_9PEZI|nr:hypothetical protein FKW77_010761 [Venturia effusa]